MGPADCFYIMIFFNFVSKTSSLSLHVQDFNLLYSSTKSYLTVRNTLPYLTIRFLHFLDEAYLFYFWYCCSLNCLHKEKLISDMGTLEKGSKKVVFCLKCSFAL